MLFRSQLPQVQNLVFESSEEDHTSHLYSVTLDTENVNEEILTNVKRRISDVILANIAGPKQLSNVKE